MPDSDKSIEDSDQTTLGLITKRPVCHFDFCTACPWSFLKTYLTVHFITLFRG